MEFIDAISKPEAGLLIWIIGALATALLPIILFFKIWEMTNDIARIREILETLSESQTISPKKQSEFWRLDKVPFRSEPDNKDSEK
jgi:hypothetical protein